MDKQLLRKYQSYKPVPIPDRKWPDNVINRAPIWCSVDLRDGNQALVQPMNLEEKLEMFNLLVEIGFKEIEVGFPAASKVEFDFTRQLIERDLVPDDVSLQVLTQAKENLIKRSFEALDGAKQIIMHLYNSTSTLQRRVVFRMSQAEIIELGVRGAAIIREQAAQTGAMVRYEYSPESFTGTELDFAVDICEAVMREWQPDKDNPVILNLPATVEMSTPNIYADQIEWFCRHLKSRSNALISLHAHNDRGSAVAATELALMAGGDRVEGTLFGNGERTGNVDLLTLALNMYTQGIDPGLDLHNMDRIVNIYERCTRLRVPPRQPYAGELVYTAFSGSHQDAINKGMRAVDKQRDTQWQVPYLPIDPGDLGRSYESVIRINSQSGKGGIAHVMSREFGFELPKAMYAEFGAIVQRVTDKTGEELLPAQVMQIFEKEYLDGGKNIVLNNFNVVQRRFDNESKGSEAEIDARIQIEEKDYKLHFKGTGPLDAFCQALRDRVDFVFTLCDYYEHALTQGSDSMAVSYIMITDLEDREFWGVALDTDITVASIKALLSAVNRAFIRRK